MSKVRWVVRVGREVVCSSVSRDFCEGIVRELNSMPGRRYWIEARRSDLRGIASGWAQRVAA